MLNLSPTKQITLFFSSLFLLALFLLSASSLAGPNIQNTENFVDLDLRGQSMAEVAKQISKQLNYTVLMSDQLADIRVYGKFNNVTLEEFFARNIFRNKNIAILYDDTKKTVIIRDFGNKQTFTEYRPKNKSGRLSYLDKDDESEIEVTPGVKLKDLAVIEDSAPTDIEVTPGFTIADLDLASKDDSSAPADIEVTPGHTIADLDSASADDSSNPADIEVTPGHTIADLDLASTNDSSAPEDIEVTPGFTISDIKNAHPDQTQQSD